jgi:hypothetical protein
MRLLYYALLAAALAASCNAAPAHAGEIKMVLAALQPLDECTHATNPWLKSGCLEMPKPQYHFYVPCGGQYECPVAYKAKHTDWGTAQALPPVTVVEPKRKFRNNRGQSRSLAGASGFKTGASTAGTPVAAQAITQLAHQAAVFGAQMKGAAIGGAAGGIPGALAGAWIGCSIVVQGFLAHDFYQKERWDLHPEIMMANLGHTLFGCSPLGFIQRMQEAKTDRDRIFALAGSLAFVPNPIASLVGQLAPAGNALLPKDKVAAQRRKVTSTN